MIIQVSGRWVVWKYGCVGEGLFTGFLFLLKVGGIAQNQAWIGSMVCLLWVGLCYCSSSSQQGYFLLISFKFTDMRSAGPGGGAGYVPSSYSICLFEASQINYFIWFDLFIFSYLYFFYFGYKWNTQNSFIFFYQVKFHININKMKK